MEVLRELRETLGCPWNWRTCAAAARGGHLEALIWARENRCGFPWDVLCAFAAVVGWRSRLNPVYHAWFLLSVLETNI